MAWHVNQNASDPTGLDAYIPKNKPGRGFGFLRCELMLCVGVWVVGVSQCQKIEELLKAGKELRAVAGIFG